YNEEKRIEKTLLSVGEYLSRQSYDYEIIVISDGSKDNTIDVVSNLKSAYSAEAASATKAGQISNLKIIDNKENYGKGWAVRKGMLEARGDYRLFMDADNSTTVDQVEGFLSYFLQGYDIVIGSRRIAAANIAAKQPWVRDFLGGVFRLIVHTLVPLGVKDSQAGFKAFSRKATEAIFAKQTIFRWAFDVEILAIARKLGFKIKEAPIRWINDTESKVKISGMIKMLFEVLQVRLNLWANKYK
ncbi:MAG: glycosyltransferase family 2 protein, partial [Candidatus Azambacteria bacterium]|nr:glycosyltransferase family 2 protein [Candidatus Azambacteria bacterium]